MKQKKLVVVTCKAGKRARVAMEDIRLARQENSFEKIVHQALEDIENSMEEVIIPNFEENSDKYKSIDEEDSIVGHALDEDEDVSGGNRI